MAARLRIAALDGWFGDEVRIGTPELVDAAMSIDVVIWVEMSMPEDRLDLLGVDADGVVGPVEQQVPVAAADVQHLEGVQGDLDVLEGRHVERRDDHGLVGLLEHGQRLLVERRRGVDDDVVEHGAQGRQGLADQRGADPLAHVRVARRGQHLEESW